MSLETLLEAAKYIEYRSEAKARGETPQDFSWFARLSSDSLEDNNQVGAQFALPSSTYSPTNNDDNSSSYYDNESKDRRRSGGAGTREVHNKLEKNRRAHLKRCFETLRKYLPNSEDKKTSNLGVLRSAFRYIQNLKRKEMEHELEVVALQRTRASLQQRLANLHRDFDQLSKLTDNSVIQHDHDHDNDSNSNSTSTASECGPLSDAEDEKIFDDASQESNSQVAMDAEDDNGVMVSTDVKSPLDVNNKNKSLTLLAKSAEAVSLASIKIEPLSPKASAPTKITIAQSSAVTIRAVQPHPKAKANNAIANGGAAVGETTVVKVEPQASSTVRATAQRTFAQAVPQGAVATNGNAAPAPPAAIKVLAPQTVRILAPVAANAASKTLATARVALAAAGSGTTVPLTTLALGKTVPGIKRVASLAPVQNAAVAPATAMKGLLPAGPSHGPIAVGQLAVMSNNGTNQPILAATTVNFQAAAPLATSSPSASMPATTVARQLVTATTMKPVTQVGQVRSQVAQITQVIAPTTLVSSVGQVIPGGSSMNPIVAPMSVMSTMNRTTVAQVISPSQLGKVISTPYIKNMPVYHQQQQLFPNLGAVTSQAIVSPIVMVTTPNVVPVTTTTAQATHPSSR